MVWGLIRVALGCLVAVGCLGQDSGVAWSELPPLPDKIGVAGAFAGVSGDALIVAGGANFPDGMPWEGGRKVWHNSVYVLRGAAGEWQRAAALPRPLGYGVSITTPQGVICIGGGDATQHYATVFMMQWDGTQVSYSELPSLPQPLANSCGAVCDGVIYVAGGESTPGATRGMQCFWALDMERVDKGWQVVEPWSGVGRSLSMAGVQGGNFYLMGGVALNTGSDGTAQREYLSEVWRFNPKLKEWSRVADLPYALAAAPSPAAGVGQSHLFVLGGDDGSRMGFQPVVEHPGFVRSMLAYHTITDTWSVSGEAPVAHVTTPCVYWQGSYVVPSGEVRPGVRSAAVRGLQFSVRKVNFGLINYLTLFLYLGGMVWLGSSFMSKNKTTDDFFRGGQRIPWWAAGVSIFATMLSSITFMAIPAQAYSVGWNLFLANSYLLITPLVVWVYLPFYRKLNITSAYEYLEQRFNVASRLIASGLFMLFQCGRIAIVLFLPSLALATVSDLSVTNCILLMGVLCVLYTMLGGMEAVIWTDFIQTFILLGGALWALVAIMLRIDGGVAVAVREAAAHGKFFQSVSWDWSLVLVSGWIIMIGSIFTNLFPYTASQDVVQRYVTTPDEKTAARAIWSNAAISLPAQAIFFAIGTALFVFYRHYPERLDPVIQTDGIFPLFIVNELPAGIAGLIVAGIFAAAQSTLAGSLNSVATAWVTDFHVRIYPEGSDRSRLRVARLVTLLVGGVGTGVAIVLAKTDIRSLWETFIAVIGLFGGTISGLFMLGVFSRRAHGRGALVGAVASTVIVGLVYFYKLTTYWLYPVIGVTSCVVLGWVASLVLPESVDRDASF